MRTTTAEFSTLLRVHAQMIAIARERELRTHACTIRFALAHGEHVPNSKTRREKARAFVQLNAFDTSYRSNNTARRAMQFASIARQARSAPLHRIRLYSPPSFVSWIYRILISLPVKFARREVSRHMTGGFRFPSGFPYEQICRPYGNFYTAMQNLCRTLSGTSIKIRVTLITMEFI